MAVTQATTLADFTSGIGTAGAVFQVDNANNRIGIGTTNPQSLLDVDGHADIAGIATVITLHTTSGSYSAGTDTKTDAAIIIKEEGAIYTEDGTQYLRTLIEKKSDTINIGQHNTALINGIELKPGSNGQVKIHSGGNSDNVKFQTTGIGVSVSNGAASTATIAAPTNLVIDPAVVGDNTGLVRIKGDLFVDGTTTQINSTTLEISDFVVGIASTATTDLLTDGAGIKIGPDNTFLYEHNGGTNASLKSSENLNVASGKVYQIGETERLSADTLSVGTGATVHSPSSDTLTLGTNDEERLRITSDGKIGIGITNPDGLLTIKGNSDEVTTPSIRLLDGTDSREVSITNTAGDFVVSTHGADDAIHGRIKIFESGIIQLENGGASGTIGTRLKILADGKLLAGHTASRDVFKETRVQISGANGDDAGLSIFSTEDGASAPNLILGHSRNGAAVDDGDILGDITFVGHDGTDLNSRASIIRSIMTADGTNNSLYADLVFYTKRNSGGYPEESLRITSNGKVGIGSETPAYKLDLGESSSTIRLVSENNGTAIRVGAGGGTNDVTLLRVDGNNPPAIHGESDSSNYGFSVKYMGSRSGNANSLSIFGDNQTGTAVEAITVLQDGHVGINETDPAADLVVKQSGNTFTTQSQTVALFQRSSTAGHGAKIAIVAGTGGSSDINFGDTADEDVGIIQYYHTDNSLRFTTNTQERLRITSGGSVGIGTNNPGTTLDVNGILQLRGSNYTTYATRIYSRLDSTHCSVIESFVNSSTAFEMMGTYADSAGVNPRIVLGAGGQKVGINTTNPQAQLHVAGTIHQTVVEYPTIRPTLDLNFAATKVLDDRITFTRDSFGTYTDELGIVKYASNNVPRFDHDPTTGESLGLLIEESRTNQFPYSSEFDNGAWNASNSNTTANQITAPDGTVTADKITADATATEARYINDDTSITNGNVYTQSVFAKAGEITVLQIAPSTGFASRYQNFDLSTGQLGSGDVESASITAYPNGWYRCTVTQTATTTISGRMVMALVSSSSSGRIASSAFNLGDGLYLWGAQLEVGSFVTSYIPTSGPNTGSTVTRAVDSAKITGTNFTDFHNATEGTLYGEYKSTSETAPYIVMLSDGTDNNRTIINANYDSYQGVVKYNNGTNQAVIDGGTPIANANNKTALAFKKDDFALSLNGGAVATDTSGDVSVNNMMTIGSRHGIDSFANTTINAIKYYNKRLPNAQLQGLTYQ